MSYIPIRDAKAQKTFDIRNFFGINRKEYAKIGEFVDVKNLSSENYPYISPSKPRCASDKYNKITVIENGESTEVEAQNIRAAIDPGEDSDVTGFCGVIGTKFYYDGKEKPLYQPAVYDTDGKFLYGMKIPSDGVIQLLWVNKIIVIHGYGSTESKPFIYYYDTTGVSGESVLSYEYQYRGKYDDKLTVNTDGTATLELTIKQSQNEDTDFYKLKAGDSVFMDGVMTYNESRWGNRSKRDISAATVTAYEETRTTFDQGMITWRVTLKMTVYNYLGENPKISITNGTVYHIYKKIPYMTHLALHKGRLWGASPNGETVYASALNDVFNFNQFDGINDDSVYMEASTVGEYLGVVSCGESIALLKKNNFEAVYGSLPNEFAVGRSYNNVGCIDINSCAVIDNALYFLGRKGFYVWNGSKPKLISEVLDRSYTAAFGYTDGQYYLVSAESGTGCENLVYDTKRMLWLKEDDKKIDGAFSADNRIYVIVDGKLEKTGGEGGLDWSAESGKIFGSDYDLDRAAEIWIYAKLSSGCEIEILTAEDGGEKIRQGKISGKDNKARIYRVPLRLKEGMYWQYMLRGRGKAVIYGIRSIYDKGGRVYSQGM